MLKSDLLTYLAILIIIASTLLFILQRHSVKREGFADEPSSKESYEALRNKLKTSMTSYCDLAAYVQSQMKIIYTTPKPANVGPTESEAQATAHIQQMYIDVYACKDDMASSRQTCKGGGNLESSDVNPGFIPCSTYTLPPWNDSDTSAAAAALNAIPDDLPDRVARELDWYAQIVKKLSDALALGNSPPPTVPDSENSPSTDSKGKPWSKPWSEGFEDTCTPVQAQSKILLQKQAKLKAEQKAQQEAQQKAQQDKEDAAASCTLPSIESEIARVSALLDTKSLQNTLAKSSTLKTAMVKLKEDQQKAKEGTLFDWQKSPPKKSYKSYPTGNRTESLLATIQQNR